MENLSKELYGQYLSSFGVGKGAFSQSGNQQNLTQLCVGPNILHQRAVLSNSNKPLLDDLDLYD